MHNADNYIRYLEVLALTLLRERETLGGDVFDDVQVVENDFPPTKGGRVTPYNARQLIETEIKARQEGRRSFGPCVP